MLGWTRLGWTCQEGFRHLLQHITCLLHSLPPAVPPLSQQPLGPPLPLHRIRTSRRQQLLQDLAAAEAADALNRAAQVQHQLVRNATQQQQVCSPGLVGKQNRTLQTC